MSRPMLLLGLAFSVVVGACAEVPSTPTAEVTPTATNTATLIDDYVPGPMAMRRLTKSQYVGTLRALFGQELELSQ